MIARITVAATLLDCVVLGAGAGAPQVGIVPANAEPERTHIKATAIRDRFMVCLSIFFEG